MFQSVIILVITLFIGYGWGWFMCKRKLGLQPLVGGAKDDPLLREAESEVEALLAGTPPEEQKKKRLALLPPADRPRHPRLTEIQRRAIAGLLSDGIDANIIDTMTVNGVVPPTGKKDACVWKWSGGMFDDGENYAGEWGAHERISRGTWAYVRRVIEQRPVQKRLWVFQYKDGARVNRADILTCGGEESGT